jgi:hypothetical protein
MGACGAGTSQHKHASFGQRMLTAAAVRRDNGSAQPTFESWNVAIRL